MIDETGSDGDTAPRITIGVMTRNYARFLPEAIESVLSQDFTNWEMVIADDGSTDETPSIAERYLADPRVRYVRHKRALGQAGNWRFCLEWGTAPIVGVLHADDLYLPGTLRWAAGLAASHPNVDLLFGNAIRFKDITSVNGMSNRLERVAWSIRDAELPGVAAFDRLLHSNHALPSTSFVRRNILLKSGFPDLGLKMMVDAEFLLRLAAASEMVVWTNRPVTRYREHGESTSAEASRNGLFAAELPVFCSRLVANLADAGLLERLPREILERGARHRNRQAGRFLFRFGVNAGLAGRWLEALRLSARGIALWPGQAKDPRVITDALLLLTNCQPLLRQLHRKRLAGVIGDEEQSLT